MNGLREYGKKYLPEKLVILLKICRSKGIKAIIAKSVQVYRQYGVRGVRIAIQNKLLGRNVFEGIIGVAEKKADDEFGNAILQEQQGEFCQKDIEIMIKQFSTQPLISVIMPIYNAPSRWIEVAIQSLKGQYYTNWELCAVDDGSTDLRGTDIVRKYMQMDQRIKLYCADNNSGISKASNRAIEMAQGTYAALLDQDDELPADAFFWFVKAINDNPSVEYLYSDECKIDESGSKQGFDFLFKSDWAPCLLINNMFIGHLVMYKMDILRDAGGFDSAFDFGQDYELAVRLGNVAKSIVHIPRILYYWRTLPTSTACGGKSFSNKINMAVPYKWLKDKGLQSNIRKNLDYNYPALLGKQPFVSVILVPQDKQLFVENLQIVVENTEYSNYEIIVVTDSVYAESIKEEYPFIGNLQFVLIQEPINYLEALNKGAGKAVGNVLVFMNAACIPASNTWMQRLVDSLQFPGVGAVSPAVLNSQKSIEYAGSSMQFSNNYNFSGTPYEAQGFYGNNSRYLLSPLVAKETVVLSRDCFAMRSDLFEKLGNIDSSVLSVRTFNEDISFRVADMGKKCYYNANAQIVCHRVLKDNEIKKSYGYLYCLRTWFRYYKSDPYFSPMMRAQLLHTKESADCQFFATEDALKKSPSQNKKVLVFTHELSRTGAPVVILDAVKEMLAAGLYVVVVSPFDGPLRFEYEALNVILLIDRRIAWGRCTVESGALFEIRWYMDYFVREFDLLFIGTLMGHNLIYRYQHYGIPILWWVHEGKYTLDLVHTFLPIKLEETVSVYCGGKYVQQMLEKYGIHYKTNVLLYGLKDMALKYKYVNEIAGEKVRFLVAGTIDERKGQDVVFAALDKLPKDILQKIEILFIGAQSFGDVYDRLMKEKSKYPNVCFLEPVGREALFRLYNEIDCLICSSRDDPMPVVATEAMMFSKVCICSTGAGTAQYLQDIKNGLVFENENANMLAEKISYAVENRARLSSIGMQGRKVYEVNFAMETFRINLLAVLDEVLQ